MTAIILRGLPVSLPRPPARWAIVKSHWRERKPPNWD